MRKSFAVIICLTFCLPISASALSSDYYLQKSVKPEKLLPGMLNLSLNTGDTKTVYVDILPKGASDDIFWTISPAIATLTQKGTQCILTAQDTGSAVLTAYADSGISCSIDIKITEKAPEIRLEADESVMSGESAVVRAITSADTPVKWTVKGIDSSLVSFGGNLCKIKPKNRGLVMISASLGDTTVTKTLEVLPSSKKGLNLKFLGIFLALSGIVLLTIVFAYRRKYERQV